MKKILFIAMLVMATSAFSQRIINKDVGEFNEIKVYDLIEVNLIKSDKNRILIKGEKVDDIKFVNKDGTLKLRMQLEKKFQGEQTLIEVYYTDLDIIDGNEGARIVFKETVIKDKILSPSSYLMICFIASIRLITDRFSIITPFGFPVVPEV